MPVCIDASFPLEFLMGDKYSAPALSRWNGWLENSEEIYSPPLFRPEVTSAIIKRVAREKLEADDGLAALGRALLWPVHIWPEDDQLATLQLRAYELALRFKQRRAYDAQYLAAAEFIGCELWTADERLYNGVSKHLRWVRWIGEDQT